MIASTPRCRFNRSTRLVIGSGWLFRLLAILLMLADDGAGGARAGTLIEFRNLSDREPARLVGYLARPDTGLSAILGGDANRIERYPAVVVLHGCGGFSSHAAEIADRMGSWGYVALA